MYMVTALRSLPLLGGCWFHVPRIRSTRLEEAMPCQSTGLGVPMVLASSGQDAFDLVDHRALDTASRAKAFNRPQKTSESCAEPGDLQIFVSIRVFAPAPYARSKPCPAFHLKQRRAGFRPRKGALRSVVGLRWRGNPL